MKMYELKSDDILRAGDMMKLNAFSKVVPVKYLSG